ncbi:hypothetical protein DYBT9275_01519 [Dyadobacter sp. CECT 9275]|uniref:Beta-ketoacyl synthase-like N-terminal domain-containing protein n=1 Tax=Dyadobacter helix TaxID=2822344 RepID=A0A916JA78_9BACT|nr:beta-ketoacyl synthase chain length factor [Dyadobacter sp. CECT 9275]CAG4995008.1 hypothetical protein DYBT9275_01519 [Dyadobacter sp. CECT 9275]
MIYITDLACISPQPTFDHTFFEGEVHIYKGARYLAVEPGYTDIIPAGLLRRMGKAVRMGVGAGLSLLRHHPDIEGIILGTGNGGLEDCLKFLNQIVDYAEGTLTPTNFVQSTPNAVAGNLALMGKLTGYNATHVHKGLAFENALLDAMMLLEERKLHALLVGSVEEISDYNHNIDFLNGNFKEGDFTSETLLKTNTPGTVNGEGAAWFVVSDRKDQALAEIADITHTGNLAAEDLDNWVLHFLKRNQLEASEVEMLMTGMNGDVRNDYFYTNLQAGLLKDRPVVTFKNVAGEHPTASAFATWLAVHILSGSGVPASVVYSGSPAGIPRNILLYNHHLGEQHALILMRSVNR